MNQGRQSGDSRWSGDQHMLIGSAWKTTRVLWQGFVRTAGLQARQDVVDADGICNRRWRRGSVRQTKPRTGVAVLVGGERRLSTVFGRGAHGD